MVAPSSRRSGILYASLFIVLALSGFAMYGIESIFLPGRQPNIVQSHESPSFCQGCHQTGAGGNPVTITADWQGSLMAHGARDPIFYAAVAVANKDVPGSGEFCIRCHSPSGWLEGRSNPPTGEGLAGNDLQGVHCDVCHRMKDPMLPDTSIVPPVPGYGNGMYNVQITRYPKRGPFTDAIPMHEIVADSFQRSGNLCGVCHNVSNPLYATNATTQSPHEYSPIERTYSEWLLSWYAQQGEAGTCQGCHMRPEPGYGCNHPQAPFRSNVPKHDLTGGNTFVPDILADFWPTGIDTARLALGKQRAIETLQSAATLEALAYRSNDTVTALIRVTNLTGHKLPTGYPEGRRAWIHIVGTNVAGDTIFQSAAYNVNTGELTVDTQAKIYQAKPGLTPARAVQYGLPPGPSFHFVLNDTFYLDNRIPPRGFTNAAFSSHKAEPVAYTYADGQYWDVTTYKIPSVVTEVTATLLYQTASKEYITFLRDENVGNVNDWRAWGDSLYAAWNRRGKSRPVVMNTITVPVNDSIMGFSPVGQLPVAVSLDQNYPNPFNPTTTIRFNLNKEAYVALRVYDLLGRDVQTVVQGRLRSGSYRYLFDATDLPSGFYFYTLTADNEKRESRKMLLLK